ncbi:MAG TPA: class I SAM-dependent methyltransferase [Candidatus Thermoplasmatota archaeon]|nr:class I SAM-dependent methyltransferase [Candidatus Thermoplasmatota archaeon]
MPKDIAATHEDWEAIADTFHRTRRRPWPSVLEWSLEAVPRGGRVLDLAGGNGRHGVPLAQDGYRVVLADFSRRLASHADRERRTRDPAIPFQVVQASAPTLPLQTGSMDGALFIAALHNIPGRTNRIAALAELHRVLKPGAPALVTVWSRWQQKYALDFLKELPSAVLKDRRTFGDRTVPWSEDGSIVERYYHFYSRWELREDLHAAGFDNPRIWSKCISTKVWADNLFAEVRRPA